MKHLPIIKTKAILPTHSNRSRIRTKFRIVIGFSPRISYSSFEWCGQPTEWIKVSNWCGIFHLNYVNEHIFIMLVCSSFVFASGVLVNSARGDGGVKRWPIAGKLDHICICGGVYIDSAAYRTHGCRQCPQKDALTLYSLYSLTCTQRKWKWNSGFNFRSIKRNG